MGRTRMSKPKPKRSASENPLHGGVRFDMPWQTAMTRDGKECRDRLSWGGITSKNACDCVGRCRYDAERSDA